MIETASPLGETRGGSNGKWKLAVSNEAYIHSSCLYYFKKIKRTCQVIHYDEVLDWKNMYE